MILGGFFSLYQNTGQQPPGGGGFIQMLIMFGLIFVIFYVLIILPSRKRQKKHQEMVEQLRSGDKIVTTGGIYGKVTDIKEQTVTVEIADNVRIRIDKNAILKDNTDLKNQK